MKNEIFDFIYHENQLLDEGRYEEWGQLFDTEGVYWVPGPDPDDPNGAANLIYDTKRRIDERLVRMKGRRFWSQSPPSAMTRVVGNLRVVSANAPIRATGKLIMVELRRGVQRVLSGTLEYELNRVADSFKIRRKKVLLIQSNEPFDNLTFLV